MATKPVNLLRFLKKQNSVSLASVRNQSTGSSSKREQHSLPKKVTSVNDSVPFRKDYSEEKCGLRRKWVEDFSGTELKNVASWWPDESLSTTILKGNIEQPIGTCKIPLGVVGPLNFNGAHAKGSIVAPMATTEGALIASICRGAKAVNLGGGANTWATQQRMTRSPLFQCDNPIQAMQLGEWIKMNRERIQDEVVCKFSRHAQLKEIISVLDMEVCHALFRYETGDAAGQNQTTICTWEVLKWIRENVPREFPPNALNIKYMNIDGNLSSDKKTSSLNALMGRGMSVTATAEIPEDVLQETVGISSDLLSKAIHYAVRISERANQQCGFNGNVSNILAGVFTATGQDIACVHESSLSRFDVQKRYNHPEGGVKISMYIPSLVVGSVGGGTSLPTQRECLEMMDCYGNGKVRKLAEIIAGYCLALDLSTYSAVAAGHFADAHDRYGRNRPT